LVKQESHAATDLTKSKGFPLGTTDQEVVVSTWSETGVCEAAILEDLGRGTTGGEAGVTHQRDQQPSNHKFQGFFLCHQPHSTATLTPMLARDLAPFIAPHLKKGRSLSQGSSLRREASSLEKGVKLTDFQLRQDGGLLRFNL